MSLDGLPTEFDVIVIGTGLTETIASAAFSRNGLTVLHLDRNDYYGTQFANFNFKALEKWKENNEKLENKSPSDVYATTDELKSKLSEGEILIPLVTEQADAQQLKSSFHIRKRTEEEQKLHEAKKRQKKPFFAHTNISTVTSINECSLPESVENLSQQPIPTQSPVTNLVDSEKIPDNEEGQQNTNKNIPEEQTEKSVETNSSEVNTTDAPEVNPTAAESVPPVVISKDGKTVSKEESNVCDSTNSENKEEKHEAKEWTVEDLQDEWRHFCFDITPQIMYCSGEMVSLLIKSDVARYCEFRTVSRLLTILDNKLLQVPCSRADVFSSKIISLLEKRLMMKFLQFASDFKKSPDDYKDFEEKTFSEFLKSKKLTKNLQHFVQNAIAMVNDEASTVEGLEKSQAFLQSLGRYGNTAFLFPLYGSGELPQAFSRLSAVFGGIYCLNWSPTHLVCDAENRVQKVVINNREIIKCKYLITDSSYLPASLVTRKPRKKFSRAILITNESIHCSQDSELSLLNFICKDSPNKPVTFLELPSSACVCPTGLYAVHLLRECVHSDPELDFTEIQTRLFLQNSDEATSSTETPQKPKILWSMYFAQEDFSKEEYTSKLMPNVTPVPSSSSGTFIHDFERCALEARIIFEAICPNDEFLPTPPNPEDIIHVDDTETTPATGPAEFQTDGDSTVLEKTGQGDVEEVKKGEQKCLDNKSGRQMSDVEGEQKSLADLSDLQEGGQGDVEKEKTKEQKSLDEKSSGQIGGGDKNEIES